MKLKDFYIDSWRLLLQFLHALEVWNTSVRLPTLTEATLCEEEETFQHDVTLELSGDYVKIFRIALSNWVEITADSWRLEAGPGGLATL